MNPVLNGHINDFNNPHQVTADQVGAPSDQEFSNHVNNKTNPHQVTAVQAGALPITGGTLQGNLSIANGGNITIANGTGTNSLILGANHAILSSNTNQTLTVTANNQINFVTNSLTQNGQPIGGIKEYKLLYDGDFTATTGIPQGVIPISNMSECTDVVFMLKANSSISSSSSSPLIVLLSPITAGISSNSVTALKAINDVQPWHRYTSRMNIIINDNDFNTKLVEIFDFSNVMGGIQAMYTPLVQIMSTTYSLPAFTNNLYWTLENINTTINFSLKVYGR